jgi:hypothetical protein
MSAKFWDIAVLPIGLVLAIAAMYLGAWLLGVPISWTL